MNINIVCVGKLKEKYLTLASEEYEKRISRFAKINIIEIKDEVLRNNLSLLEEENVKKIEGEKILKVLKKGGYNIALDLNGSMLSSPELSSFIEKQSTLGSSTFNFIIGGSLGLSKEVLDFSHFTLTFSKMTFPHQLFRIMLLEQIYRAFKINNNESYHK